jgi:crotonobetainyl-CoA:carnitine CoA-transferase CaiB-like acyl-CoA transferase
MSDLAMRLAREAWEALGGGTAMPDSGLSFTGVGALPSAFAVTDVAAASVACAGMAVGELLGGAQVAVDRRLASMWFAWSLRPIGWERPSPWSPTAGDYRTADGWIKLHNNSPHHFAAATAVLGELIDRENVARLMLDWRSDDLEAAIVAAGGASAAMRSQKAWAEHPQGQAVNAEPLAHIKSFPQVEAWNWSPKGARPLAGLRVLDLTRVLAGPVATRFLAGYGAEVLRIDPLDWDETGIIPEVALGKRCARLDLKSEAGRETLEGLLAQADVLLHGYRPHALERLGFGAERRREIRPDLIDVSLCAYGWTGPWASRRGYDSLLQMSNGIADTGMAWAGADKPNPLPVQALDHAAGYFLAASAVRGVTQRKRGRGGSEWRLSLARTGKFLTDAGAAPAEPPLAPETPDDLAAHIEQTGWGPAQRVKPPLSVDQYEWKWERGAPVLGSSEPVWLQS